MALGNTLTVTLDGSGGTAKALPLVNGPQNNRTDYMLDEGTKAYRANVRHARDSVKSGELPMDRHTVTFSWELDPDVNNPLGSKAEVSFIIRCSPNAVPADVIDLSEAMSFYMVKAGGVAAKLLGWES